MKTSFAFALIAVLSTGVFAQPLSGSYTIGGNSPDFISPQAAFYALKSQGVSGPTFFNIRSGVFTRNNGTSPVMTLDSLIAGLSSVNRITFQSDASSGANADNCIFEINFTDPNNGTSALVWVRVPFITFNKLTFRDVDSLQAGAVFLVKCQPTGFNLPIQGLVFDGCKFIGNPYIRGSAQFGTDYGLYVAPQLSKDITVRNCSFTQLRRAIYIGEYNFTTAGQVIIEDCTFTLPHSGYSGNGNALGSQITADGDTVIIRRNHIDLIGGNGGFYGIYATVGYTGFIEQNIVKNRQLRDNGGTTEFFEGITVSDLYFRDADSVLVVNNMVSGNATFGDGPLTGLHIEVPKSKVFNNTIVGPFQNRIAVGINLRGANCKVFNNIVQIYGQGTGLSHRWIYDFGNPNESLGLLCNNNVVSIINFYGTLVRYNGVNYPSFGEWQATGYDTSSIYKILDFIDIDDDPHLTDCQMQDPDLIGIPFPEVTVDIDGDGRSTSSPTIGADEAVVNNNRFFGAPFKDNIAGFPYSITAGKFDSSNEDGIALPDYDNQQVFVYHNNTVSRSFTLSNSLSTSFKPLAVLFYDFDNDGNQDLIVGGDNPDGIKVFWGDGAGGFAQSTEVATDGAVLNIQPGFNILGISPLLVPMGEVFGYLLYEGNRQICFALQLDDQYNVDTLGAFMHSITKGDFNNDGSFEVAGVAHFNGDFVLMQNFDQAFVTSVPCNTGIFSDDSETDFATGWYSYANSIISGDFDGDLDIDFVTASGSSGRIVYIRNDGNLTFTADTIQVDHFVNALVAMDYDVDGDLDFVTANWSDKNGITIFINDGLANFHQFVSCYQDLINNQPTGIVSKDFDLDGLPDIAVVTLNKELSVLYNMGAVTSVNPEPINVLPEEYVLQQNYPNPFNPSTTIEFSIPNSGLVQLSVYNILGEEIKQLINEERQVGKHSVQFNTSQLASGIYLYRLQAGSFVETKKMILIK